MGTTSTTGITSELTRDTLDTLDPLDTLLYNGLSMPNEENNLSGEFVLNQSPKDITGALESDVGEGLNHKHKAKFYSSLCVNPKEVTFENQEAGEEIVLLVRRDLITNVPWIVTSFFLIFVPPLILMFSNLFTPFIQVSFQTLLVLILFYYLIIFGFILVEFTLWYFNVGLVTNKRIIDLDVSGILYKHASETKLNLIEDVSYSQVGSIRSIFNYGDIHMQTAGTLSNFEFDRAPEPAKIVRIIADMIGGKSLK